MGFTSDLCQDCVKERVCDDDYYLSAVSLIGPYHS
jgi:hypothetical protein